MRRYLLILPLTALVLAAAEAQVPGSATSTMAMPAGPGAVQALTGIPPDFLAELKAWRSSQRPPSHASHSGDYDSFTASRALMGDVERYIEMTARTRFPHDPDVETAWADNTCAESNKYDYQYECTMAPVRKALPLLRSTKGDARPYIILGIDRMLTHIEVGFAVVKPLPTEADDRKMLTDAGIEPDCTNDGCPYKYDLAKLLWAEQPETEAGQDALTVLMLNYMGCRFYDKTVPDPFGLTARTGEEFLRKHPGNVHNLWVMLGTADAYRLKAADQSLYDSPQVLQDTPDRKRAMELYLAVARFAPQTVEGDVAESRYHALSTNAPFLLAEEDPCTWD